MASTTMATATKPVVAVAVRQSSRRGGEGDGCLRRRDAEGQVLDAAIDSGRVRFTILEAGAGGAPPPA